jgi:hypothetical protein
MEIRHHLEAGVDRVAPIIQLGEAVGRFISCGCGVLAGQRHAAFNESPLIRPIGHLLPQSAQSAQRGRKQWRGLKENL